MNRKAEPHLFDDATEDTISAVAYLRFQSKEYSASLAFELRSGFNKTSITIPFKITSYTHNSEIMRSE